MFAEDRRGKIYEIVLKHGTVTTNKLIKTLNVSDETIRRDLLFLEKQGLIKRIHGGATLSVGMKHYFEFPERASMDVEEKTACLMLQPTLLKKETLFLLTAAQRQIF